MRFVDGLDALAAGSIVLGCLATGLSGLSGGVFVKMRGRLTITAWPVPTPASAGGSIPQASYIRCFIFLMASGERDSFS